MKKYDNDKVSSYCTNQLDSIS